MTDSTPTPEDPQVRDLGDRYAVYVDGSDDPVGFTLYTDHEGADGSRQRIFPHTEVDDQYEGRGLASRLVREALTRSTADGYRIVPVCPYVKDWIDGHDAVSADQVDEPTRDHLEAVGAA
ncbi:GNAT family N-acetyltransferase [Micrococcus sp.]|uniref:GNAT family N-acetyltransferase n=1 Tax=Micrococcus sp. TaxID=1271 RepID=UPI0026DC42DC|nr:GNAT family N-acetyltransferase [Micrococcus sp.]MDO4240480.1 GNAT family N-acetyltransferase [Micrococcus sp.]